MQMRSNTCDLLEPPPVASFLYAFMLACDTYGIHERTAMWLFDFFIKGSSGAALHVRLCLALRSSSDTHREKEEMLSVYPSMVNYLLLTYAKDDVVR